MGEERRSQVSTRSMNDVGAEDIAVGQLWRHAVAQAVMRHTYRVVVFNEDSVVVERVGGPNDGAAAERKLVSFGALLAYWVLVAEAS